MKEDAILARELGKLGALGGALAGGLGGALGGGIGAGLVARMLPNDTLGLDVEVGATPDHALKTSFRILRQEGRAIEGTEPPSDLPTLYAIIGSGIGNLNPALVRVEITPVSEDRTKISIRGTAKEGLIKQRAGEKAARRIAALLSQALSSC